MTDDLFSRDQALGGLPARRADAGLFLIESRTAQLVARSRTALARILPEALERERDLAFLEAFALGREPPLKVKIQDLEHFAPQCARLVPDNPPVRAALAHRLAQKYHLTRDEIPNLRAALGLDTEAVQQEYPHLYHAPLDSIYKPDLSLPHRLRWLAHALTDRLESLSPFWTAFALTFTETVGSSILALPIAVAGVGPLPAIVLLIVLGLVNVLTIAFIGEAVARTGSMRYGSAYFGRLIDEYLGGFGSSIVSLALAIICIVALFGYYLGFARTLAEATPLRAEIWALALFLAGIYFVTRGSLASTVTSALVVGAINVAILLALSIFALTQFRVENALYANIPFVGGRAFDPSLLELIFGVVIMAYFGHTSIGNCAKIVLRRDPSSRTLLWGAAAAQLASMALYALWVFALNSAIPFASLARQKGTALTPLAEQAGALVAALGAVYVVLGMGMASVHYTHGLVNLVRERLPSSARHILILQRQHGRLLFEARGRAEHFLTLAYWGIERGAPVFRFEFEHRNATLHVNEGWDDRELDAHFPDWRRAGIRLALWVLDASDLQTRLQIVSTPAPRFEGDWEAVGMSPEQLGEKMNDARPALEHKETRPSFLRRVAQMTSSPRGRFVIPILPITAIFLFSEYLLVTERGSFAAILSLGGVIGASIFVGIFPVLILASSRRKGDWVPGVFYRFFGNPLVLGGIYLLFIVGILLQGLFILQNPVERAFALLAGALVIVMTVVVARRGAFTPRAIVELRGEERVIFNVTNVGEAALCDARLSFSSGDEIFHAASGAGGRFDDLRSADFSLTTEGARELKVWVHQVTPEGNSEGVNARLQVIHGDKQERLDLNGQVIIPAESGAGEVRIEIK